MKKFKLGAVLEVLQEFWEEHWMVVSAIIIAALMTSPYIQSSIEREQEKKEAQEAGAFREVSAYIFSSSELIYDEYTKIIYIKAFQGYNHYTYLPYYSENGKLCRYIDGEIVEVSDRDF